MTQFGFLSHSSSPAAKRIEAAARAYAAKHCPPPEVKPLPAMAAETAEETDRPVLKPARERRVTPQLVDARRRTVISRLEVLIEQNRKPTLIGITGRVSRRTGISIAAILSDSRAHPVVCARQECFWRARHETKHSLPVIGRFFNRDHTTILHGIQAHEKRARPVSSCE